MSTVRVVACVAEGSYLQRSSALSRVGFVHVLNQVFRDEDLVICSLDLLRQPACVRSLESLNLKRSRHAKRSCTLALSVHPFAESRISRSAHQARCQLVLLVCFNLVDARNHGCAKI